jgi:hypothetical protein
MRDDQVLGQGADRRLKTVCNESTVETCRSIIAAGAEFIQEQSRGMLGRVVRRLAKGGLVGD